MATLVSTLRQTFPGKPRFTEKDVPDQTGKVTIVTGSNTGLGKEVAQILYSKNAKVYMMARSEDKTMEAIASIKDAFPRSTGELIYLHLDLEDLTTVKQSANVFLQRESRLDILFNNAGLGYPGKLYHTKQGHELQLGVNCVGPFAFTKLLTPILASTAKVAPADSVRVVWVSSSAALGANPNKFVDSLARIDKMSALDQYATTKLGNYLHGAEFARRHAGDGIVSVALNPGNLDTDFLRAQEGTFLTSLLRNTILHPPIYGAYTILFAGVSAEVTKEKSGSFAPWGRIEALPKAMVDAAKTFNEGGSGSAQEFWEWSEAQVGKYL